MSVCGRSSDLGYVKLAQISIVHLLTSLLLLHEVVQALRGTIAPAAWELRLCLGYPTHATPAL